MKVELVEYFDPCEVPSRGFVMPLPARLRDLLSRFPAVSHGLLSLTDQVIVSGTSFATMMIIGRATSPDYLGLYYLLASIVVISVGIQEQIVAAPYTIYSKRYQGNELASYVGSVWFHHFALTALGAAMLLAAIAALSLTGSGPIVPGLWALLGAGPLLLLREWIRRFAFANLQIVPAVALDLIAAVLQLGGLLLLWRLELMSIFAIFAVMGAACAFACVGWYALDTPAARFDRSRFVPDWHYNWSFGRWAVRSYLVGNTTPYIMSWILGLTVSTAAAGILGACVTLINISNVFLTSVDRILTPRAAQAFASGGCGDLRRVLILASAIMLPTLGVFCGAIFVFGSPLAVFVYGDQYVGLGATLSTLAAAMFMNGLGTIVGNGLWAIDQPRSNFTADLATLLVTIGSAVLLVASFGVFGAALAMLAGTSTGCIVRAMTLRSALESLQTSTADFRNR